MALSQAKLELVFQGAPAITEQDAIDILADRFLDFFLDSTVTGASAVQGALAAAETAFRAAAIGLSQAGQSAAKVQSAISAFWTAALASAPTVWVTIPLIVPGSGTPPPTIGGISAALTSVFASNQSANANLATASAAAATAIMPTQLGATVTLSPPPPGGTPGVPIL